MTQNKKIILLIISHLFVAIICLGGAAIWFEKRAVDIISDGSDYLNDALLISRYSALVDIQRTNAYPDGYREALLIFSDVLDQSKEINSMMFSERTYNMDKTLTFERLSRVEKELGNVEKSNEYIQVAKEYCSGTGWKDCSIERITEISARLEQSSVFNNEGT